MKCRVNAIVPVRRSVQLLGIHLVGGDRELAGVIEKIVEEDLPRRRKELQYCGRRGCTDMFPATLTGMPTSASLGSAAAAEAFDWSRNTRRPMMSPTPMPATRMAR